MDDFYAVDFHTAAARAVAEVAGCTDPDGEPVHVALTLALHAWKQRDPPGRAGTDWSMFGTGVWAACDELPTPPLALVVYGDQALLADTRELRADAATLVTTVGRLLERTAADPHADPTTQGRGCPAVAHRRRGPDRVIPRAGDPE